MTKQDTIVENEIKPGAIPNRPLTFSELVELKIYARDTISHLSAIAGFLETYNLEEQFECSKLRLQDTEVLMEDIRKFCIDKLKAMDARKSKVVRT